MQWPPKQEHIGAWTAIGTVPSGAAVAVGLASGWSFVVVVLAILGVYLMVGPPLELWPWHQAEDLTRQVGRAGHSIKASGDIETDRTIEAGHGIEAGRDVRSPTQAHALLFPPSTAHRVGRGSMAFVNPLFGHYRIRQFARPLEYDERGCIFRVAIAPDCRPVCSELSTATKDAFRDALFRSSLEVWGCEQVGRQPATAFVNWERSEPNSGQVVTVKRDWGVSAHWQSTLSAKATLQLPAGPQFGPRPVLIVDVIERAAETGNHSHRLSLSLAALHGFLHILARTAVDEIASTTFPSICGQTASPILGPNYEISFGDRTLDGFVEIPSGFERPQGSCNNPGAEINTPEDSDAQDLAARDAVIRDGMQKIFRQNSYDKIEDEIASLPRPPGNATLRIHR
jgi:hypothetical protein